MKAIVVDIPAKIDDFREINCDKPRVKANEVLIDIHAMAINPVDNSVRTGDFPAKADNPFILGTDVAGVVAEVGEEVTKFAKGDPVFASSLIPQGGALAEYMAVPEKFVVSKPDSVSFEDAAGLGVAALTAYQLVNSEGFEVKKGERVLIQSGSGGVGTYAIQFAKQNGAEVTATTSRNEELLKSLGADQVVNYKEVDIPSVYSDQFDMLINTVSQATETLPVVVEGGRALTAVSTFDEEKAKARNIKAERLGYRIKTDQLAKFADQIANNELKVIIDKIFPFTEAGVKDAFRLSESGHAAGKIIVRVKEKASITS